MTLLIAYTVLYYLALGTSFTGVTLALFKYIPDFAPMIVFPAIIATGLAFIIKYMIASKKEALMKQMVEQYQQAVPAQVDDFNEEVKEDKKTWIN